LWPPILPFWDNAAIEDLGSEVLNVIVGVSSDDIVSSPMVIEVLPGGSVLFLPTLSLVSDATRKKQIVISGVI